MAELTARQRTQRKYLAAHRDHINEGKRLGRAIARDGRLTKEELRALGRAPVRSDFGREQRPLAKRFWEKVAAGDPDECWEWQGSRHPFGYGTINVQRRPVTAHRIAYQFAHGDVPAGLYVLHHCDNPPCVNPAHLFLGTAKDNTEDMMAKGRGRPFGRPQ